MSITKDVLRGSLVTFPKTSVDPKEFTFKSGTRIAIEVEPDAPFVCVLSAGINSWNELYVSPTAEIGAIRVTLAEDVTASKLRVVAFASLDQFAAFKADSAPVGDGPPGHVGNKGIVLIPHS